MPKKKAGRPRKDTEANTAIIVDAVARGVPPQIACHLAGVAERTVRHWVQTDEEFCRRMQYAHAIHEQSLIDEVKKKDPWKLLKNWDSIHFKDEVSIEQRRVVEHRVEIIRQDGTRELLSSIARPAPLSGQGVGSDSQPENP